jgi:hypothetical protein
LTKGDFLKRCELLYDSGFFKKRSISSVLRRSVEVFLRLRHVYAQTPELFEEFKKQHQGAIAIEELLGGDDKVDPRKTLANDPAYKALEAACVFDHPCQQCAEDKSAWHTRYGFCDHKKEA